MSNKDQQWLEYIDDNITRIGTYLGRAVVDPYTTRSESQEAILGNLEHLADATIHLSTSLRRRHPEVDWARIREFRNAYAHDYTDIKPDRTRQTIENYLPLLQKVVAEELGQGEIS